MKLKIKDYKVTSINDPNLIFLIKIRKISVQAVKGNSPQEKYVVMHYEFLSGPLKGQTSFVSMRHNSTKMSHLVEVLGVDENMKIEDLEGRLLKTRLMPSYFGGVENFEAFKLVGKKKKNVLP